MVDVTVTKKLTGKWHKNSICGFVSTFLIIDALAFILLVAIFDQSHILVSLAEGVNQRTSINLLSLSAFTSASVEICKLSIKCNTKFWFRAKWIKTESGVHAKWWRTKNLLTYDTARRKVLTLIGNQFLVFQVIHIELILW